MRHLLAALCLTCVACAAAGPVAGPPPDPPPANPWSEPTRTALAPHCGSCHRSDLATAVPGALEVFDLIQEPWYVIMSDEQLTALARRARAGPFTDAEKDMIDRFVACARGGSCAETND